MQTRKANRLREIVISTIIERYTKEAKPLVAQAEVEEVKKTIVAVESKMGSRSIDRRRLILSALEEVVTHKKDADAVYDEILEDKVSKHAWKNELRKYGTIEGLQTYRTNLERRIKRYDEYSNIESNPETNKRLDGFIQKNITPRMGFARDIIRRYLQKEAEVSSPDYAQDYQKALKKFLKEKEARGSFVIYDPVYRGEFWKPFDKVIVENNP